MLPVPQTSVISLAQIKSDTHKQLRVSYELAELRLQRGWDKLPSMACIDRSLHRFMAPGDTGVRAGIIINRVFINWLSFGVAVIGSLSSSADLEQTFFQQVYPDWVTPSHSLLVPRIRVQR